jgi:hypothetical protein
VYADDNDDEDDKDNNSSGFFDIDIEGALRDVLIEIFGIKDFENPVFGFTDKVVEFANFLWQSVGGTLTMFGGSGEVANPYDPDSSLKFPSFGITDFEGFANRWKPIFQTFAYSLIILLFGVSFIETALQYELMTAKGAVKIFGRLLFAKIWVDLSTTICLSILGIANSLFTQIVTTQLNVPNINPPVNVSSGFQSIPIIGIILDITMGAVYTIPVLIMAVVVAVVSIRIIIKLTLRSLEIALMMVVAPVFFACWVGEATKQYFRKFMLNFIGVVFNIVFMAIVYIVGTEWLSQSANVSTNADTFMWLFSMLPWLITLIAIGGMMVKPPKLLTSIIE